MSALSGDSQIFIGIDHDLPSTFIGLHTGFSERDVGPTLGRGIAKQITTVCGFTKSTATDSEYGKYGQSLEDDFRDTVWDRKLQALKYTWKKDSAKYQTVYSGLSDEEYLEKQEEFKYALFLTAQIVENADQIRLPIRIFDSGQRNE
ncbi:uncharacterized protein L199_000314 [Kwoniella botswanensis]|uniref:uncharacterized protein n=1 Tax=Kwoniella botswanensis TaxID=1268659 RepID=UPI00315D74BB